MELQNRRGWKGPLGITKSSLPATAGSPQQAAKEYIQVGFQQLQMWPHQSKGENLPHPAGHTLVNTLQDTIGLLGYKDTAGSQPMCCPPGHPGPFLQSSSPTGQPLTCTDVCSYSSRLCIISKLAEGGLYPFIHVTDADNEKDWIQYKPLGNTASYRPPIRLCS